MTQQLANHRIFMRAAVGALAEIVGVEKPFSARLLESNLAGACSNNLPLAAEFARLLCPDGLNQGAESSVEPMLQSLYGMTAFGGNLQLNKDDDGHWIIYDLSTCTRERRTMKLLQRAQAYWDFGLALVPCFRDGRPFVKGKPWRNTSPEELEWAAATYGASQIHLGLISGRASGCIVVEAFEELGGEAALAALIAGAPRTTCWRHERKWKQTNRMTTFRLYQIAAALENGSRNPRICSDSVYLRLENLVTLLPDDPAIVLNQIAAYEIQPLPSPIIEAVLERHRRDADDDFDFEPLGIF